jgi:hypothetical protein
MTTRERQDREYAAERIEDAFWRLIRLMFERRLACAAPDADLCPWCGNTEGSHECLCP